MLQEPIKSFSIPWIVFVFCLEAKSRFTADRITVLVNVVEFVNFNHPTDKDTQDPGANIDMIQQKQHVIDDRWPLSHSLTELIYIVFIRKQI